VGGPDTLELETPDVVRIYTVSEEAALCANLARLTEAVHGGAFSDRRPDLHLLCDPSATFERLLHRYVEQNLRAKPERVSRTDEDVKDTFSRALAKRAKLKTKLFPKELVAKGKTQWRVEVEHAWKNGVWNCVQPVSLDLIDPNQITAKAAEVAAKVRVVTPSALGAHVVLYVGLPPQSRPEALSAAQEAIDGVRQLVDNEAEVVLEEESEQLLDRIERDVSAPLH
jgi:hypothetical protein